MKGNKSTDVISKNANANISEIDKKLKEITTLAFEEKLTNIINLSQIDFLKKIEQKTKLAFDLKYKDKGFNFEDRQIVKLYKDSEKKLTEDFKSINKLVTTTLAKYKKEKDNTKYLLTDFQKHCGVTDDIAIHTCEGQMYVIYEKNLVKFIICSNCKKLYTPSSILLYCYFCSCEYSSKILDDITADTLLPATWENSHCNTLAHDKMRCIKCKETFFLNTKENLLQCKSCKYTADPLGIIWQCRGCKADYKSAAIPFNIIEVKIRKKLVKDTLNLKRKAKPLIVPCCNVKVYDYNFFHKKSCEGELFQGEFNRQNVIVCDKCKMLSYFDNYIWTCPKCFKRFRKSLNSKPDSSPATSILDSSKLSSLKLSEKGVKVVIDQKNPFASSDKNVKSTFSNSETPVNINDKNTKSDKAVNYNTKQNEDSCFKVNVLKEEGKKIERKIEINKNERKIEKEEVNYGVCKTEANVNEKKSDNKIVISSKKIEEKMVISNKKTEEKIVLLSKNEKTDEKISNNKSEKKAEEKPAILSKNEKKIEEKPVILSKNEKKVEEKHAILCKNEKKVEEAPKKIEEKKEEPKDAKKNEKIEKKGEINAKVNTIIEENKDLKENVEEERKEELRRNNKPMPIEKLKENEETLKKLKTFKIEDYKVLQSIGEGANGVIYIVQNFKKEKFAMKKIILDSDMELDMYLNEYELIHTLNHPHVVKIQGISYKILDDTTNVLYILMELAKSDWHKEINLRAKNNNPYTEEELIYIMKEIIESLYYLQMNNIAHRDIKPHNILIFENKEYKLADFGEAKVVKMQYTKKQMGTLRGTELYMAPVLFNSLDQEEIVEHNPYKSDVFSLGYCILLASTLSFNILYELRKLTNKKEILEIITKNLSEKFSQKFIMVVCRMVEFNEKFRFDFIQLKEFFEKNLGK